MTPPYGFSNKLKIKDVGSNGKVWCIVDGTITEFSADGFGQVFASPVSDMLRFSADAYMSDYLLKDGEVWIATAGGLWRYDSRGNVTKQYVHDGRDPNSLSQNFVSALGVTSDQRIVVGTLHGLNIYNPISDDFDHVEDCSGDAGMARLNNNFVNCILVDGNRIWVGTEGGGINKFTPHRLNARIFRDPEGSGDDSSHPINAILQDSGGMVWIGNVEGGLSRCDSSLRLDRRFTRDNSGLAHNSVSALCEDPSGLLWIGTWGGGLDIALRDNSNIKVVGHIDNAFNGTRPLVYIGSLVCDTINNCMWIGCNRGLYCFDLASHTVSEPFADASDIITGSVASVVLDGHLWIGGNSGLCDVDLHRRDGQDCFSYRLLSNKLDAPSVKNTEKVTALYVASDGDLWIGTNGNGVYRRHVDATGNETFENYTTIDGLPNNMVMSVMEDGVGRMWAGTAKGLSCRSNDGTFVNFDCSDGLLSDKFYWNAFFRMSDGTLLFGTTNGLVAFGNDALIDAPRRSEVKFTRIHVGHAEVPPSPSVSLHEGDKSLNVEFSALDYDSDGRGYYYYRLSGFEKDWIKLPPRRHNLDYTNLSPGHYVLQVRYLPPGMAFDEARVASLPVEVRPYFYKRWWFIFVVAIMLYGLAMMAYKWRVGDLKRQRALLRKTVSDRTYEITTQKRLLEAKTEELSEQNRQLKASNEEITRQKIQLSDMARRVQELSVDRISFFTNITHEFRTPITLILGPIERALKLSYNPQVIEQLHFAERNSKYLLSLVNQLMDFRKVESGKMEIVKAAGNFRRFIEDTVGSFTPLAEDRGIDLRLVCRLRSDVFVYDEEALRKVVINLLGNAVKFTPDGGRVSVYVAQLPDGRCTEGTPLYINVSDSGNGLDEADYERVFERFYQGASQLKYPVTGTSGSGIGLYLCRSIVEIYGGRIWARNNRNGVGCSFRMLLPIELDSGNLPQDMVATTQEALHETSVDDDGADGQKPVILVVEDNDDMRAFIRSILADHYAVVQAKDGEEALQLLMSRHIDFIITDLMMPGMDGLELSKRVKEDFAISHIPILVLTAKTSTEARLESFRTGVDEYLQKPFDEELLLARIRNILDNRNRQTHAFNSDMNVGSLNIGEDSRDRKFMDQVMAVVKDNYKNSYFEVGDFAEALGISRSLLNKKLQSLAGQSAGQLIRSYRMNLARELIIQNRHTHEMNISEIAYEVGFNDSKYFTRCFTKQFGVSPSAFMAEM